MLTSKYRWTQGAFMKEKNLNSPKLPEANKDKLKALLTK